MIQYSLYLVLLYSSYSIETIAEFRMLSFKIGDVIKAEKGIVFGIVYVKV